MKRILLCIFLTAECVFGSTAYGTTCIDLFSAASRHLILPVANQADAISTLSVGSTIEFADGAQFKVQKVLSVVDTDGVFLIDKNQVLRVPKHAAGTINQYIDGYSDLVRSGIPVPRILGYRRGERIVVEAVEIEFHLSDIFLGKLKLNSRALAKLESEFLTFLSKFRDFDMISDLHAQQVAYIRDRGWMLLDWRDQHRRGHRINPFIFAWESIPIVAKTEQRSIDINLLQKWRRSSDRAIAEARGQNPEDYNGMSLEVALDILYQ